MCACARQACLLIQPLQSLCLASQARRWTSEPRAGQTAAAVSIASSLHQLQALHLRINILSIDPFKIIWET